MATNDSILNTAQKKVLLYRGYTETGDLSATQYLPATQSRIGINGATPNTANTDLDYPVPIEHGTVNDDGDNTLTGSSGGDNTTDNTTTYKEGAGVFDVTAQNLIANNTNATKIWTISNLATLGTNIDGTKMFALWIYIKDAAALAKFLSAGTALEVKLGSDTSNYFSVTYTASALAVGWNWITSNKTIVNDLTETGTVSGDIDTFIIEITTNNATDTFVAGDVMFDLLRTWTDADTRIDFISGYPNIDLDTLQVTIRTFISSVKANGFLVDNHSLWNEDATKLMLSEDKMTGESKSLADDFAYVAKDRLE